MEHAFEKSSKYKKNRVDTLDTGPIGVRRAMETHKKRKEKEINEIRVFLRCSALFGTVRKCSSHHAPSMLKWSKAKAKHNLGG